GVGSFGGAEVIVSRVEWERAQGLAGRLRGYLPQHWPVREPVLVDGTYDVTGDGSLLVLPTPGHTPGHVALIVRDDEGGFFLGGAVANTPEGLPAETGERWRRERLTVLLAPDRDL